ncbi:MAG: type II toxin-antitoxin system VapB family antitoxin [Proteobacteria bacterium]|jgi:Arc/MetJ family transcription regulator|nr:type II toxin-antitoxin system VapB family antitoxin [Pseudomonadota bacterium]
MRTNIVLDDQLVSQAMKYTRAKTKKEVIALALQELVESRKRLNLADLRGKVQFAEGYDYKAMRKGV